MSDAGPAPAVSVLHVCRGNRSRSIRRPGTRRRWLAEFTRPNALFLTVAASFNHLQLSTVHDWFTKELRIVDADDRAVRRGEYTRGSLTDPGRGDRYQERIEALLRAADLGIAGLRVDPAAAPEQRVRLLHHSGAGGPVPLDFVRQESLGTLAWFGFLGPLLDILDHGGVLLVDELDASLHPMLAAEAIRMFQDPRANPKGAQLVFTTHDATLLGTAMVERPIDRDQVWITTKRKTGETDLYPLIDARPRKGENLERGYLRGRYGGVPRVTSGELARESFDLWLLLHFTDVAGRQGGSSRLVRDKLRRCTGFEAFDVRNELGVVAG